MTDKRVLILNDDGTAEVNGVLCKLVPVQFCWHCKSPTHNDYACWSTRACSCGSYPHKNACGNPPQAKEYQRMLSAAAAIDLSGLPRAEGDWSALFDGMGVKK